MTQSIPYLVSTKGKVITLIIYGDDIVIIGDDMVIIGDDNVDIDKLQKQLPFEFEIKDLCEIKDFFRDRGCNME